MLVNIGCSIPYSSVEKYVNLLTGITTCTCMVNEKLFEINLKDLPSRSFGIGIETPFDLA